MCKVNIKYSRGTLNLNNKKTLEGRKECSSGVFIVNFEHILHFFLVILQLNFNR